MPSESSSIALSCESLGNLATPLPYVTSLVLTPEFARRERVRKRSFTADVVTSGIASTSGLRIFMERGDHYFAGDSSLFHFEPGPNRVEGALCGAFAAFDLLDRVSLDFM